MFFCSHSFSKQHKLLQKEKHVHLLLHQLEPFPFVSLPGIPQKLELVLFSTLLEKSLDILLSLKVISFVYSRKKEIGGKENAKE